MRRFYSIAPIWLAATLTVSVGARENVAFFGLVDREDPMLASYFAEHVYRAMLTDSLLIPVPSERWQPWVREGVNPGVSPSVEPYRKLAEKAGADYFVMAYAEPYQYHSKRIWWKPWGLTTRMFHSLRLQIFKIDSIAIYDGVVAFEDSLKRVTPFSYRPVSHQDPTRFDAWRRESYGDLAQPVVRAIRAAVSGKPQPSAVFVKVPPKADKGKKKKKKKKKK